MKLIWHGHACFELVSSEGRAVFDPYAPGSVKGLTLPPLTADAVFCSHGHGDHNYREGVALTGRAPAFCATQIKTYHDEVGGAKRGDNLITVVEAEGLRIAHCGDIGHALGEETLAALGKPDLLLIPVGGVYTVDAAGAKAICDAVRPRVIVPMHYRSGSRGLQNVAPVEDFLRLFPTGQINRLPSDTLTVESLATPCVAVFQA